MFFKDVFRLIKTTSKRFFAIAAIVLIGVAFMFGLFATTDIMKESVRTVVDEVDVHDYQIYSNYGFDENDFNELKKLEYVDEIFASKTRDVFAKIGENDPVVFRVRELDSNVDKYELKQGERPKKENECLIIDNGKLTAKIGDVIKLSLEDEEIKESLINDEFIITGICSTPEYMSKLLSTSLLNNLDLESVIYVPNSNFVSEYYTSLVFTLKDAKKYNPFENEYYDFIEDVSKDLNTFVDIQEPVLKNRIVKEANEEIEDAKKELADGKRDGEKELADALKKLNDAKIEIRDGENEIIENEQKIADAQVAIDDGYRKLKENEATLNSSIKQVEEASGLSFDELYTNSKTAYETYNNLKNLNDGIDFLLNQTIFDHENILTLNIIDQELAITSESEEPDKFSALLVLKQTMNALGLLELDYNDIVTITSLNSTKATNTATMSYIDNQFVTSGGVISTYNVLSQLYNGRIQLSKGYEELNAAQYELEKGKIELEDGKRKLLDAKKKYQDGLKEYEDGLNDFNKEIEDGQKEIDDAVDEVNDLPEAKWVVLDRSKLYSLYMYKSSCDQMNSICIVIPIIFFLVAALVCSTTMKRLIDEQRGQIGIYCALGYSKASIALRYLSYVLIASLISSVLGLFIGIEMFPTVIYNTWRLLYNSPPIKMVIPMFKLFICVFAFATLMCLVSYFEISQSLKESPASLMRPKAPKNTKTILLERIKFVWNKLSFTSKITARNIFRYKSRFLMTILGIAGCTGLLVLGFGIKDSISNVVNLQYNDILKYNYTVNLDSDKYINEINKQLRTNDNVEDFACYMSYIAKTINKQNHESTINVFVIKPNAFDKLFNLKDYRSNQQLSLKDDGVIITEKFAIKENLNVGDYLIVSSNDDIEKEVKIVGISKMYFQHYLYMSENFYINTFNDVTNYTNIGVKYDGNDEKLFKLANIDLDIASVNDFSSFIDNFNLMISALNLIIIVIIITSGALALVVLINLINVNISERIREIATLKVLGFRNNEVNSYIFKEIIILTIIGSLIGLPLGVIELNFVMNIINVDMIMFPIYAKPMSFVYAFTITMIFTIMVLITTRKTLRKIEMVESLKSIE